MMFQLSTDHDHVTSRHISAHDLTCIVDLPQLAMPSAEASRICPSPLQRDVGGSWSSNRGVGGGETRGGTQEVGGPSSASRKWATTNVIARFLPFLLPSPTTYAHCTQAPGCHHHHLPRIEMQARGGYCPHFNTTPTATTSLMSKREPEVVIFILSTQLPPQAPPLHPNVSRRWSFSFLRPDSHHYHLPRIQT